jgi:hypothetical protein
METCDDSIVQTYRKTVLTTLETFTKVKAPSSAYLAALQEAREQIDDWFEAVIDAARG